MNQKKLWITLALINLSVVALLGFIQRSKILFPLKIVNYEHFINAHSHFGFGGWIALSFFTLFTYTILPDHLRHNKWYPRLLWAVELTSIGMLFTLPFQGHGPLGILFSTLFIFATYAYSFVFLRDLLKTDRKQPVFILATAALVSMVISTAGPFTLGWMEASGSSDAILFRDAIYYFLHFQYNGFFTLAVFAVFFNSVYKGEPGKAPATARYFAYFLAASIIPSFFLSLLWHPNNFVFKIIAIIGIVLILATLYYFFRLKKVLPITTVYRSTLARTLWLLVLISFVIKSVLQMGTILPDLGNLVFGYRPIIIGFLHLVFLGLVTFYLLSNFIEYGYFDIRSAFVRFAIWLFAGAVIAQETVLMVQGVGLLLLHTNPIYNWLLWILAILLFLGALFMAVAGLRAYKTVNSK